jgi:hypothetical protein
MHSLAQPSYVCGERQFAATIRFATCNARDAAGTHSAHELL